MAKYDAMYEGRLPAAALIIHDHAKHDHKAVINLKTALLNTCKFIRKYLQ